MEEYIPAVECSACESCYELFGYQLAYIIRYVPREEAEKKILHSNLKPNQVLIEYKCWDCGHINYEKITLNAYNYLMKKKAILDSMPKISDRDKKLEEYIRQILEKYRDIISETDDLEKIDEILHYKDLERELFKR